VLAKIVNDESLYQMAASTKGMAGIPIQEIMTPLTAVNATWDGLTPSSSLKDALAMFLPDESALGFSQSQGVGFAGWNYLPVFEHASASDNMRLAGIISLDDIVRTINPPSPSNETVEVATSFDASAESMSAYKSGMQKSPYSSNWSGV